MYVSSEVYFAQNLASNEKKIRGRTLKKLKKWIVARSANISSKAFTDEDLLKLWKGLFYCMWMCDKPLNQEELAREISSLIHCFCSTQLSFLFIDTFFQTISREWNGLDKFRLEKFLMFVRQMLRESFSLVCKLSWKLKQVKKLRIVLEKTVLNATCEKIPLGLKLHVADIYLQELARVADGQLPSRKTMWFLRPYCNLLATASNSILLKAVSDRVFKLIIKMSNVGVNSELDEESEQEESLDQFEEQLECDQDLPALLFDYKQVANLLLKTAKSPGIRPRNRSLMYALVAQFRDLEQGIHPFEKPEDSGSDLDLTKEDIKNAVRSLRLEEENIRKENFDWIISKRNLKKLNKRQLQDKIGNDEEKGKKPEERLPDNINVTCNEESLSETVINETESLLKTKCRKRKMDGSKEDKVKSTVAHKNISKGIEKCNLVKNFQNIKTIKKEKGRTRDKKLRAEKGFVGKQDLYNHNNRAKKIACTQLPNSSLQKNIDYNDSLNRNKSKEDGFLTKIKTESKKHSWRSYESKIEELGKSTHSEAKLSESSYVPDNSPLTSWRTQTLNKVILRNEEEKQTNEDSTPEINSVSTPCPFARFKKNCPKHSVFFRKAVNKVKKNKPQKLSKASKPKHIHRDGKKVNFLLSRNKAQDPGEYLQNVRNSPSIPFDASKKPSQGVLKKSRHSTKKTK